MLIHFLLQQSVRPFPCATFKWKHNLLWCHKDTAVWWSEFQGDIGDSCCSVLTFIHSLNSMFLPSCLPASLWKWIHTRLSLLPRAAIFFPTWHWLTSLYLCLFCFLFATLFFRLGVFCSAQLFLPASSFQLPAPFFSALTSSTPFPHFSLFLLRSLHLHHFHPHMPSLFLSPPLPTLHPLETELSINSIAM